MQELILAKFDLERKFLFGGVIAESQQPPPMHPAHGHPSPRTRALPQHSGAIAAPGTRGADGSLFSLPVTSFTPCCQFTSPVWAICIYIGLPCDGHLKVGLNTVCIALACIGVDGYEQTSRNSSTKCVPAAFTISLTHWELSVFSRSSSAVSLVQPVLRVDEVIRIPNGSYRARLESSHCFRRALKHSGLGVAVNF